MWGAGVPTDVLMGFGPNPNLAVVGIWEVVGALPCK